MRGIPSLALLHLFTFEMLKKVLLDNAAHILRSRTDLMEESLRMSGWVPGCKSTPLLVRCCGMWIRRGDRGERTYQTISKWPYQQKLWRYGCRSRRRKPEYLNFENPRGIVRVSKACCCIQVTYCPCNTPSGFLPPNGVTVA